MPRPNRSALATAAASILLAVACDSGPPAGSGSEGGSGSTGGNPPSTDTTSPSTASGTSSSASTNDTDSSSSGSTSTSSGSSDDSSTADVVNCGDIPALGDDFSYIWVSNSPEGTLSKINTRTLAEEARYQTRPDTAGSPSRTSVNLNGDVAVANRTGGITLFRARMADCIDPLNTSSGADDVKAWPDGCMGWHTPFDYSTQRPVAWTEGEYSEQTCRYENTKLWTAGAATSTSNIEILLLDGETGALEATVPTTQTANTYGMYGGAVDDEGNFWGSMLSGTMLFKVDLDDMSLQQWPAPSGYGIALDTQGRPWTCQNQLARFNPGTETWDTSSFATMGGGCMVDANDTLWVGASNNRLLGVDVDTMAIEHEFELPGYAKGVSIDFDGNIWAVSLGTQAWRVDTTDGSFETFTGLTNPYTYSDMTGFALAVQAGRAP